MKRLSPHSRTKKGQICLLSGNNHLTSYLIPIRYGAHLLLLLIGFIISDWNGLGKGCRYLVYFLFVGPRRPADIQQKKDAKKKKNTSTKKKAKLEHSLKFIITRRLFIMLL